MEEQKLSLKELADYIGRPNIADELDEHTLSKYAERVIEDAERDWDTMEEWRTCTEKGMDLIKPPTKGRSEPWEGASNFKSPIIQEAAYKFGERATRELLRPEDLVKVSVIGTPTEEKEQTAKNVSTYQSYQVNHEIPEWREEQRQLFYMMPNFGTVFKHTFYDNIAGHLVSENVHWPNFAVDQASASMAKLPRFSMWRWYTDDEIHTFEASGIWTEQDLGIDPDAENLDANGNDEGRKFIEQYTALDIDGDGYGEPYIVTVHCDSKKVVRIVPLYSRNDITVKVDDDEFSTLDTYWDKLTDEFGPIEEKNSEGEYEQSEGFTEEIDFEVVHIARNWNITKYGFMPSLDGTFLDVGYFQLLSALINSINTGVNQLHDAATLENLSGGYYAKGFRAKKGRDRFRPGEWKASDVNGQDFQQGLLPLPTKPPSATLKLLTDEAKAEARQLSAAVDVSQLFGPNTQATTALAMLDEALGATTALLGAVQGAMSKEFQLMYRLNAIYADPELYKTVLDNQSANYETDFNQDNLNIACTANPEYSNQAKRMQIGQIMISNLEVLQANGADGRAIVETFLDAIAPHEIDKILPEPSQDFMQAQTAAQQAAQQASESQAAWFEADSKAKLAKAERDRVSAEIDMAKLPEELEKLKSETLLNLEKAESEQATNLINVYTAQLQRLDTMTNAIERLRNDPTPNPSGNAGIPGGDVVPFTGTPDLRRRL